MILVSAGHEVHTATNGAEAVAAVQANAYDLVLMDIQMPVMDGVTATKKIRELDHPASNVPIIAMTANVLPQQVTAFGEAGMNDHVGKPFKKAELFQKVNTWLLRPNPPPSARTPADMAALDELRDLMGPEWVASDLKKLSEMIEEAFGDGAAGLEDREQLARRAHALVSLPSVVGFPRVSQLCRELEKTCKGDNDPHFSYDQARTAALAAKERANEMLGSLEVTA